MIQTYIPNYLFSTTLNHIDNAELIKDCYECEKYLHDNFIQNEHEKNLNIPYTTSLFRRYNFFGYPSTHVSLLYDAIRDVINPCLPDEPHMIVSWLNMYHNRENIYAHAHWEPKYRAIHGFYCVNTETIPSSTTYNVSGFEAIKITSKDGLLVFGKSDNDTHFTSLWTNETPRITIGFDILPISTIKTINLKHTLDRFIPFKK